MQCIGESNGSEGSDLRAQDIIYLGVKKRVRKLNASEPLIFLTGLDVLQDMREKDFLFSLSNKQMHI